MDFDKLKARVEARVAKAAAAAKEFQTLDQMAANDEYIKSEGLNVKRSSSSAPASNRASSRSKSIPATPDALKSVETVDAGESSAIRIDKSSPLAVTEMATTTTTATPLNQWSLLDRVTPIGAKRNLIQNHDEHATSRPTDSYPVTADDENGCDGSGIRELETKRGYYPNSNNSYMLSAVAALMEENPLRREEEKSSQMTMNRKPEQPRRYEDANKFSNELDKCYTSDSSSDEDDNEVGTDDDNSSNDFSDNDENQTDDPVMTMLKKDMTPLKNNRHNKKTLEQKQIDQQQQKREQQSLEKVNQQRNPSRKDELKIITTNATDPIVPLTPIVNTEAVTSSPPAKKDPNRFMTDLDNRMAMVTIPLGHDEKMGNGNLHNDDEITPASQILSKPFVQTNDKLNWWENVASPRIQAMSQKIVSKLRDVGKDEHMMIPLTNRAGQGVDAVERQRHGVGGASASEEEDDYNVKVASNFFADEENAELERLRQSMKQTSPMTMVADMAIRNRHFIFLFFTFLLGAFVYIFTKNKTDNDVT